MEYYINGIGIIAPQKTFEAESFLTMVTDYDQNILRCITPDFKTYINPIQLRRLSRMLRIGLTASILCQQDANVSHPDGIITATGYGFLEETEKFLREMLERDEKQLTPTFFMQGTYNALAGLVALSIKCTGYNNTYVSKGFAFENALQDAMLQLEENDSINLLVGAYDEAASVQHVAGMREAHYKIENIQSTALFESNTDGTIQGEGSAFFALSGVPSSSTWCILAGLRILHLPTIQEIEDSLTTFLETNHCLISDIDVWVNGMSGDAGRDKPIIALGNTMLKGTPQVRFKHLCGEYCTAVSFGLWVGASILKKQHIPDSIRVSPPTYLATINTVLVVNHYLNRNYSFILLKSTT